MIKIVEGNILNTDKNIIGHQVNCIGVMGAGLAKQIKNKYPIAFEQYKGLVDSHIEKRKLLGKHQIVIVDKNKYVSNLFGQESIGTQKQQTDYLALSESLNRLSSMAKSLNLSVALPHGIGCGLAGGDWEIVYDLIDSAFKDYEVTLVKFIQ
ncbi:macro domain-containing protein [Paraliobacillus ryukyuensis]|uniref:macro domain-containing protein n=1 Tax=Paraliobacillus ryukyuensis TaxID=200904 RepID=UPI0009A7CDBC|nr:macro domain-containing protein [Paraliobacillus ryukyuensis]